MQSQHIRKSCGAAPILSILSILPLLSPATAFQASCQSAVLGGLTAFEDVDIRRESDQILAKRLKCQRTPGISKTPCQCTQPDRLNLRRYVPTPGILGTGFAVAQKHFLEIPRSFHYNILTPWLAPGVIAKQPDRSHMPAPVLAKNEAETRYELIDPVLRDKGYRVPYIRLETPAPVGPTGPKGRPTVILPSTSFYEPEKKPEPSPAKAPSEPRKPGSAPAPA